MTTYFLGDVPTGDESGPDGGAEYDGHIWVVEPDEPDPMPVIYASIPDEDEAVDILQLLEREQEMLAALRAALPILRAYIHPDQFDGHAAKALVMVRDAISTAEEDAADAS